MEASQTIEDLSNILNQLCLTIQELLQQFGSEEKDPSHVIYCFKGTVQNRFSIARSIQRQKMTIQNAKDGSCLKIKRCEAKFTSQKDASGVWWIKKTTLLSNSPGISNSI